MKEVLFIIGFQIIGITAFQQVPSMYARIDSTVLLNEARIETIFQKTELNRLISSNGKNPAYLSIIFRFRFDKALYSATYILFSTGDTSLIINYYFDSARLIKVKTIDSETANRKEDIFYYSNSQFINDNTGIKGPYPPGYYVNQAARILKNLKRKPIRFPEY